MKIPFRRARRILLLATASIITLAVLLWAVAGWWASAAKRDALRIMKERGRITSVTDIQRTLPPDHLNFAMLPMLAELREESATKPAEDGWSARLGALGEDRHGQTIRMPKRGEPFDLDKIRKRHDIAGEAAEILREFDRRHEAVLTQLRAGLDLPHATRPWNMDFSNPATYFTASAADTMALHRLATGLAFRAELAIATGQADIALESLLIARRLSDLTLSDETPVLSVMLSHSIDGSRASAMARGLDREIWNEAQIDRLLTSWIPRDDRAALSRAINIEGLVGATFFGHVKRDRNLGIFGMIHAGWLERLFWHVIPGAWFDAQAARTLKTTETWLHQLDTPGPLQILWDHSIYEMDQNDGSDHWHGIGRTAPILVQKFARHAVITAQAQVALRLARHRLAHDAYPPALGALDGDPITDPLTGDPFLYHSDGTNFTLYSPGPDGIDNSATRPGGRAGWDRSKTDWVW